MKRKILVLFAAVCFMNLGLFAGHGSDGGDKEGRTVSHANVQAEGPGTEAEMIAETPAALENNGAVAEEEISKRSLVPAAGKAARPDRAERKRMKAEMKATLKQARKTKKSPNGKKGGDAELIIAVILAILLPPAGVWFWEQDITSHFWIDLIFWILGWAAGGLLLGWHLAWICSIIAIIYALYVILAM